MPKSLPKHIQQLREYLLQPSERNEDLALSYFRALYPETFKRQSDAANADGYVPGHFLLELKGDAREWYSGLFQALAYERKQLSFALVVVCAKGFLAMWRKNDIPDAIRDEILRDTAAPSTIGRKYAKKFSAERTRVLRSAVWHRPELSGDLFLADQELFLDLIENFRKVLAAQRPVRQAITLRNFVGKLKELKSFFDPSEPMKAVRAFYSMIYGPWDDASVVNFSQRREDRATVGGVEITDLTPNRRSQFKKFVESHAIRINVGENIDDFFARFDQALDAVDKDFRIRNGIFFTDLDLSKFAMWLVRKYIPHLGKNYLVIDPACGSGNLVTNWRSPLELRHKVVSEIEPELLFAVEQRMKGDQWHQGKFTVVPRVSEERGLNFLDKSAAEYIGILRRYLAAKGQKPDKPLAFLCNPPYRSDDDQSAAAIAYSVNDDIVTSVGNDAASERYCCFLAQMKLICDAAADSGMPDESVLLLFTKTSWLSGRPIFDKVRTAVLGAFEDIGGFMINGKEFFDVKGTFPIAFTIWRYRGRQARLDASRSVPLVDLTGVTKKELAAIRWNDPESVDGACEAIWSKSDNKLIRIGVPRTRIREWIGQTMTDFKRARRRDETAGALVGGLPLHDRRRSNSKAYGEKDGIIVGFMDDLTPCRTSKGQTGIPWFRLNPQFMDVRKNRLYSGPPTHFGYCARNRGGAEKTFLWYALARTFAATGYPMWADSLELWPPEVPSTQYPDFIKHALAIGFAENECVETIFPAANPSADAIEVLVRNPLTPLISDSFWCRELASTFVGGSTLSERLVESVHDAFDLWKRELGARTDLAAEFARPYFVGHGRLTLGAGLVQIKDYATELERPELLNALNSVQKLLRECKTAFYDLLTAERGINYFGNATTTVHRRVEVQPHPNADVLDRRLAIVCTLVNRLADDPHFGRTKMAKLFYLVDATQNLNLDTSYQRQAAGPLDADALYNAETGLEALAVKHSYVTVEKVGRRIRYHRGADLGKAMEAARATLGTARVAINRLIDRFRKLDTDQCEIVATLYACWNDRILDGRGTSEAEIVAEFRDAWHEKKRRFAQSRLLAALAWMRNNGLVPSGRAAHTVRRGQSRNRAGDPTW